MAANEVAGPAIAVRALRPDGREPVNVATNRARLDALAAYRKRWAKSLQAIEAWKHLHLHPHTRTHSVV